MQINRGNLSVCELTAFQMLAALDRPQRDDREGECAALHPGPPLSRTTPTHNGPVGFKAQKPRRERVM